MSAHVTATVRACFAALRMIRSVRYSLPCHALLTLVRALVVSKVDYCNSVLAGLPVALLQRLQSVLNAAARLVFSVRKLSEEVRAHNPTPPSTALVARSGANSVSVMCFDVSLPQWHCATVPR